MTETYRDSERRKRFESKRVTVLGDAEEKAWAEYQAALKAVANCRKEWSIQHDLFNKARNRFTEEYPDAPRPPRITQ